MRADLCESNDKLQTLINQHPRIKQCLDSMLVNQHALNEAIAEILSTKKGDIINPVKSLKLVNFFIPLAREKLKENRLFLSKYIHENNIDTNIIFEIEYFLLSAEKNDMKKILEINISKAITEIKKYNSVYDELPPKWYEFRRILKKLMNQ